MIFKLFLTLWFVATVFASNANIGQRTEGDELLALAMVDVPLDPEGNSVEDTYTYQDVS